MDSVIFPGARKEVYQYNEAGKTIAEIFYGFDSLTHSWIISSVREYDWDLFGNRTSSLLRDFVSMNHSKEEHSVSPDGHVKQITYFSSNATNSNWIPYLQRSYTYNHNGSWNSVLEKSNKSGNEWENVSYQHYRYDTSGNKVFFEYKTWDATESKWKNKTKQELFYNDSNKLVKSVSSQWDNDSNAYNITSKWDVAYQGLMEIHTFSKKINAQSSWETTEKKEFGYDSSGNQTLIHALSYDKLSNTWISYSRSEWTFNALNKMTSQIFWGKNSSNQLEGLQRWNFFYDAYGNRTYEVYYDWNVELFDWKLVSKITYHYDVLIPSERLSVPPSSIFINPHKMTEMQTFRWNGQWTPDYTSPIAIYYSEQTTTSLIQNNPFTNYAFNLYPNPVTDHFVIQSPVENTDWFIHLYSLDGIEVFSAKVESFSSISTGGIPSGNYVYHATSGGRHFGGNIILK